MKYLIKIDRATIKENPDAGSTSTVFTTAIHMTFECKSRLDIAEFHVKHPGLTIEEANSVRSSFPDTSWNEYKGTFKDEETFMKYTKEPGFVVNKGYHHERVHHDPIPPYNFLYVNTELKCNSCKKTFLSNDLESDVQWNGLGDEYFSDRICPHCKEFDCVDVEYESINDVELTENH